MNQRNGTAPLADFFEQAFRRIDTREITRRLQDLIVEECERGGASMPAGSGREARIHD